MTAMTADLAIAALLEAASVPRKLPRYLERSVEMARTARTDEERTAAVAAARDALRTRGRVPTYLERAWELVRRENT